MRGFAIEAAPPHLASSSLNPKSEARNPNFPAQKTFHVLRRLQVAPVKGGIERTRILRHETSIESEV